MSRRKSSDPGKAFFWMMMALTFAADFDRPNRICQCGDFTGHRYRDWRNMQVMIELMMVEVNKCSVIYGPTSAGD